jgi:hypothetical protein
METTIFSNNPSFFSSSTSAPFSSKSIPSHRQHIGPCSLKRSPAIRITAKKDIHGGDFGGPMADNDMFTLSRRLHEIKITTETKLEAQKSWMEWERRYYDKYCSGVCAFVGLVQLLLMNIRPSTAVAMLVLFMSSVPAAIIMVLLHLGGFWL